MYVYMCTYIYTNVETHEYMYTCVYNAGTLALRLGQTCAWHIDVEDRHSRCERGASNAGTLALRLGQHV